MKLFDFASSDHRANFMFLCLLCSVIYGLATWLVFFAASRTLKDRPARRWVIGSFLFLFSSPVFILALNGLLEYLFDDNIFWVSLFVCVLLWGVWLLALSVFLIHKKSAQLIGYFSLAAFSFWLTFSSLMVNYTIYRPSQRESCYFGWPFYFARQNLSQIDSETYPTRMSLYANMMELAPVRSNKI